MPQSHSSSPSCLAVALGALRLDADPGRAARARDVDGADAELLAAMPDAARQPAAGLLDDDRHARARRASALERLEPAAEVAIAARLDQLLDGLQVHAQRVGADLLAQLVDRAGPIAAPAPRRGCRAPARSARRRAPDTSSSRSGAITIARCEPRPKPSPSVPAAARARSRLTAAASAVPPVMPVITSGARERLAEQRRRQVDLVDVAIGQRLVDQLHVLEQRALVAELDLARGAQREVIGLALRDAGGAFSEPSVPSGPSSVLARVGLHGPCPAGSQLDFPSSDFVSSSSCFQATRLDVRARRQPSRCGFAQRAT